jgi:signal recognition particle subunit SEC65
MKVYVCTKDCQFGGALRREGFLATVSDDRVMNPKNWEAVEGRVVVEKDTPSRATIPDAPKNPNPAWNKADIQNWLSLNGVIFEADASKAMLLKQVDAHLANPLR